MKRNLFFGSIFACVILFTGCGGNKKIDLFPVVASDGKYQYVDRDGNIVINPQFADATVFRDGLALVRTFGEDSKFGYIDEMGNFVINPQYIDATPFYDGLAWVVSKDAAPVAISTKGELKFTLQQAEKVHRFSDEMAAFSVYDEEGNEKWGFVDKKGEVVIVPQFSECGRFSDGLCAVSNEEGDWGYIDKKGSYKVNPQFKKAGCFSEGVAIVKNSESYGAIDKDGKFVVNPQFEEMFADGDKFLVKMSGKWGWTDKKGSVLINPQFDYALPFMKNKLAPVYSSNKMGYVNDEGKYVINPQFESGLGFNGDLAVVESGNKIGFIDESGKFIVNPQFKGISDDVESILINVDDCSVTTDFVDIASIVAPVDFEVSVDETFDNLKAKYGIEEFKGGTYGYSLKETAISKIAKVVLLCKGNPYTTTYREEVKREYDYWYGWYNKTVKVPSKNYTGSNKIDGYVYKIELHGKANGKGESVVSSLKSKLSGYKLESKEDASELLYSNTKQNVTILSSNWNVIVKIDKKITSDVVAETEEEIDEYLDEEN